MLDDVAHIERLDADQTASQITLEVTADVGTVGIDLVGLDVLPRKRSRDVPQADGRS